jgi:hypothetical protein
MGYSPAGLNAANDGIAAAGSWIQFHTSASDGSATAPTGSTGTRAQTTWADDGDGTTPGSEVTVAIAAGVTVRYWSLWTASAAGTCLGTWQLAADEVFGAAGQMKHTPTIVSTN